MVSIKLFLGQTLGGYGPQNCFWTKLWEALVHKIVSGPNSGRLWSTKLFLDQTLGGFGPQIY